MLNAVATTVLAMFGMIAGAIVGVVVIRFSVDVLIPLKGMDQELWKSATLFGMPVGALLGLYSAFPLRQRIRTRT